MSGATRTGLRAATRTALLASPAFAAFRAVSAWQVFGLDVGSLPAFGIATPEESHEADTHDSERNQCQLVLAFKMIGGDDIEDALDAAADAAAGAVRTALRTDAMACDLTRSSIKIDGSGAERAGSVELTFTVIYWAEPPG